MHSRSSLSPRALERTLVTIATLSFVLEAARAQSTEIASISTSALQANAACFRPALSSNARYVVFSSTANNLVSGDANGVEDIFLRDRINGTTVLVSLDSAGNQANAESHNPAISADGRFVAFHSLASNLAIGDTNMLDDVFVREFATGITECVSVDSNGAQGNHLSRTPSISGDGRFVAFHSLAGNFVANDNNLADDIFVHDRSTGITELVSVGLGGGVANNTSTFASISADGRYVAFVSAATDLVSGDTNGVQDVFVRDRTLGTTERVSLSSTGTQGDGDCLAPAISADGRWVVFSSTATNLVVGDTNGLSDIFVRDRLLGTTVRVSVSSSGAQADGQSAATAISAHGRFVAFDSVATNLVLGDTNGRDDLFVHDLATGATTRVSVASNGQESNGDSRFPAIDGDGRIVAFASTGDDLVPSDTNAQLDVFVHDRGDLQVTTLCAGDGSTVACPCANTGLAGRGCDNSVASGGALLTHSGTHSPDTLVLTVFGELPSALTVFLQGNAQILSPNSFGDGLLCAGGNLKRLYVKSASSGRASAPAIGDPSISTRSAALGDPIASGQTRWYQTYYRDPNPAFCPAPQGDTWNSSSALAVLW